jgi:hypothetical protein
MEEYEQDENRNIMKVRIGKKKREMNEEISVERNTDIKKELKRKT